MPIIEFSERDIKRGIIVTPAWYRMRIDEVGEKLSKDGRSTNYVVDGTILKNADDGTEQFAGVPVSWNFNSKAPGFMVGYFQSFGQEVTAGSRFELGNTIAKELDVYVENDTYENRLINRVNHKYRVPKTVAA